MKTKTTTASLDWQKIDHAMGYVLAELSIRCRPGSRLREHVESVIVKKAKRAKTRKKQLALHRAVLKFGHEIESTGIVHRIEKIVVR